MNETSWVIGGLKLWSFEKATPQCLCAERLLTNFANGEYKRD